MPDLHPFEPASFEPSSCDHCGEPQEGHRTDLLPYTVRWRAIVTGQTEVFASDGVEALREFKRLNGDTIDYEVGEFDEIESLTPTSFDGRTDKARSTS